MATIRKKKSKFLSNAHRAAYLLTVIPARVTDLCSPETETSEGTAVAPSLCPLCSTEEPNTGPCFRVWPSQPLQLQVQRFPRCACQCCRCIPKVDFFACINTENLANVTNAVLDMDTLFCERHKTK